MKKIRWHICRLKAMGLSEIILRVYRSIRNRFIFYNPFAQMIHNNIKVPAYLPIDIPAFNGEVESYRQISESENSSFLDGKFSVFNYTQMIPIDWYYIDGFSQRINRVYSNKVDRRNNRKYGEIRIMGQIHKLQYLCDLARHYYYSGDDRYKVILFNILKSWYNENPFCIGYSWVGAHLAAVRMVSIIFSFLLVAAREKRKLEDVIPSWCSRILELHYFFIRTNLSLFSSANNHLLGELGALCIYEILAGKKAEAGGRFQKEFLSQHYTDGPNKEHSLSYGTYSLEIGLLVYYLLVRRRQNVIISSFIERLKRSHQFLGDCIDEESFCYHEFGDSDDTLYLRLNSRKSDNIVSTLALGDMVLYGRFAREYRNADRELALWFYNENQVSCSIGISKNSDTGLGGLGERICFSPGGDSEPATTAMAGERQRGIAPMEVMSDSEVTCIGYEGDGVRHYKTAGHVMVRGGQKHRFNAYFYYGRLGLGALAAHGHSDCLSLNLTVDGYPVLVDSGTYTYQNNCKREYFRSTGAHNTVEINGSSQSEILGPFLWGRKHKSALRLLENNSNSIRIGGTVSYYNRQYCHERDIRMSMEQLNLEVIDRINEGQGTANWVLHPDIRIKSRGEREVYLSLTNGTTIGLKANRNIFIDSAVISPSFGVLRQTNKISISFDSEEMLKTEIAVCSL